MSDCSTVSKGKQVQGEGATGGFPAREEPGEGSPRGLSYTNKVLEPIDRFQVRNTKTGEVFTITKVQARLSRLRRRVYSWAKTLEPFLVGVERKDYRLVMITLTYKGVDDWKPNQLRDYLLDLRDVLATKLVAYAWVAELQARGAVHYHLFLIVRRGTLVPKPDESGMWPFGMSKIETGKTVFYIVKYTGKEHQKVGRFPKGLRMFAVWIADGFVSQITRWFFRLSSLPKWFKEVIEGRLDNWGEKWRRAPGGGWEFAGEIFLSPWEYLGEV